MKKSLLPVLFLIFSNLSFSSPVLEATSAYYVQEIKVALGNEVTFGIEGNDLTINSNEKNVDFAIRQVGSSITYLAKDQYNKKWLKENVKTITFIIKKGDSKLRLTHKYAILSATLDPTHPSLVAGVNEIENVILKWIPRTGPGDLEAKTKFDTQINEYQTFTGKKIEVILDWPALEKLSEKASSRLVGLAQATLSTLNQVVSTPNNKDKIKNLPSKLVVQVVASGKKYALKMSSGEIKVMAPVEWLEKSENPAVIEPEEIQVILFSN